MKSLSERLPMIPTERATANNAQEIAQRYTGWQLLESDPDSGEILICPALSQHEHNRSRNLTILSQSVAVIWLRQQRAVMV